MDYLIHILIMIGIYSIVSMSLNLPAGYTGLLSVAHAGFYGIGAYTAALLALKAGLPFWITIPAGIIIAGIIAYLIAWPSLKTYDDYFVITTFAFQVIIFSIMNNWVSFTGGPLGLPGIPRPDLFGMSFSSPISFLCLVLAFSTAAYFLLNRLISSPFGRVLKAIREDEIFAQSVGKDVLHYKIAVFVISASVASVAGGLYAYYISFIDPTSFTIMESIFMLSIVIIGGAGNLKGSIIGSVLLISIPELLRFVGMPNSIAANMRQIFYGALLILFMMFRPQGIMGEFTFGKEGRKKVVKDA
ncbi:MAG TPA: branched-chain amino acid ABC transporter permease [Dissulfurispiraceae bacterium]